MKTEGIMMMGFLKRIAILMFILCMCCKSADESNTSTTPKIIEFTFHHSMRIPYREVRIVINEKSDSCEILVSTKPENNDSKWRYSNKKYSKMISQEEFNTLFDSLKTLNQTRLRKQEKFDGLDGSVWILKWGTVKSYTQFGIWTPTYDMKSRKLIDYVKQCENIVAISDLPINEILHD